ncbi:MAG TPA: NAD(P)-dependent oxidoreductase [Bacteroidales bacterium]
MKTILITGINGFIGSNLAKTLSASYHIIGLEYSSKNLSRLEGYNFQVYESASHIPDEVFTRHKIDIIIHTATFYGRNQEEVKTIAGANLFTPFELLDKAIAANVKLFINTDTVIDRFTSFYALSKNHFREWLQMRSTQIKAVNLQLEHFYGPGCPSTNFITLMIEKLKNNEPQIDLTPGLQVRDFIYYTDVLDAYKVVLDKWDTLAETFTNLQVASGNHVTIKELVEKIKEYTGSQSILKFGALPYRQNELMNPDTNSSALKALGWKAKVSINDGIKKTI